MKPFRETIYVTQPVLPDPDALAAHLGDVWSSRRLANMGAKHQLLEERVREHLGAAHASLTSSGTMALVLALKALRVRGEVITTPFTFAATAHAIVASGCRPVFCDVDPRTLCLDPAKVAALVTDETDAVLGVHVFGAPCDVDGVAAERGLKVIYDAAHAFMAPDSAQRGDATAYSFHATKLFHTCEGGCVATEDPSVKRRVDSLRNFGIRDEVTVEATGLNGKMSEVHAAVGLAVIERVATEEHLRREVDAAYRAVLDGTPGLTLQPPSANHFAARVHRDRDAVHFGLREMNVHARRYFYPLISEAAPYRDLPSAAPRRLPHAHMAAREVLCLPFYGALGVDDATRIAEMVASLVRSRN